MGLKFKKQTPSTEGYMGNGIFIDAATIVSVEDFSQGKAEWQKIDFDLNLKITCKLKKNDWERTVFISGNFKKDPQSGDIIDWGGAFKIMNFLMNIKVADEDTELTADRKIPVNILKKTEGKEFLLLSYPNNNGKSSTWDQIESIDVDPATFLDHFLTQWEKSGYPKNYSPNNAFTAKPENHGNNSSGNVNSHTI